MPVTKTCRYKVGDLLFIERKRKNPFHSELWIVIGMLSCTIRVKNIASGKECCMPPRWFTKL